MRGPGKAPDAIRARSQRSTPSSPPRSRTDVTPARSVSSALRVASARRLSRSSVPFSCAYDVRCVCASTRPGMQKSGRRSSSSPARGVLDAEPTAEISLAVEDDAAVLDGARGRDPTPRRSGPREWAHALADGGPPAAGPVRRPHRPRRRWRAGPRRPGGSPTSRPAGYSKMREWGGVTPQSAAARPSLCALVRSPWSRSTSSRACWSACARGLRGGRARGRRWP